MTSRSDLTDLPLEVFATVLEKLFEDMTVQVERPSMLSRIDLIARKLPQLAIFQVLNGDHHRLAKTALLKAAFFGFNVHIEAIAHPYSSFHKYLDRIQKLVVHYDELAFSTHGDLKAPYKYLGAPQKHITPYESAMMYANRKTLRMLKVKKYFVLGHGWGGSPTRPLSLRERIGRELARRDTNCHGVIGNTRDLLRLGRKKIHDRCQVFLELSFRNKPENKALDCKAMISEGQIIDLTSSSQEYAQHMRAELRDWFNPLSSR